MKRVQLVRMYSLYLLIVCLSLKSEQSNYNSYVYLHDITYNIAQCIFAVSEVDNNTESPVHALKNYIADDEKMALRSDVLEVLDYAQSMLMQKYSFDEDDQYQRLLSDVNHIARVIQQNLLVVDSEDYVQPVLRINVTGLDVNTNITMVDSTDSGHGNIFKKNSTEAVRFIHNYGIDNTCVGKRAGNFSMTDIAINNTAVGVDCLRFNSSGSRNTACGKDALRQNRNGSKNVAVGYRALQNNSVTDSNVAIGDSALLNQVRGSFNVAVGINALRGLNGGNNNVAVGAYAGYCPTGIYSGSDNVFVGRLAGSSQNPGFRNIYIGNRAGSSSPGGANNIYIGNVGMVESGVIRIGDINQTECFIASIDRSPLNSGIPVVVNFEGQLGVLPSARRFKENINEMNEESELIYNVSPVSFVYKNDETVTRQYGLIPEEVNEQLPELIIKNESSDPYTVRYEVLPVLLLHELKKQKKIIKQQQDELLYQKRNIYKQEKGMEQHRNDIDALIHVVNGLQKKMKRFCMVG